MSVGRELGDARSVLQTVKRIEYQYAEPVREVVTRLRLFPRARRGAQRLLGSACDVWPRPDRTRRFIDDFGNEVWEFLHNTVVERVLFTLDLTTEHAWRCPATRFPAARLRASQGVRAAHGLAAFLGNTPLVDTSEEIREAARGLAQTGARGGELMDRIGQWVYSRMGFHPGATTVETPASEALASQQGVCQDFTHIMLAICRGFGLPARYVSGFIPGEGYMHAWVEALVADPRTGTAHWEGFDPTHNRRPDAHYVAVASGRDYADVSPVTGWFYGAAPSSLTAWTETVIHPSLA
jgi:transglutaminase-like putative cysteine protease